jgi:hypothetical protein
MVRAFDGVLVPPVAVQSAHRIPPSKREGRIRRLGLPVNNAVAMGVIYYVLIVAMILLGSATQYRFFYGNF